jgi:hypothetical protein
MVQLDQAQLLGPAPPLAPSLAPPLDPAAPPLRFSPSPTHSYNLVAPVQQRLTPAQRAALSGQRCTAASARGLSFSDTVVKMQRCVWTCGCVELVLDSRRL